MAGALGNGAAFAKAPSRGLVSSRARAPPPPAAAPAVSADFGGRMGAAPLQSWNLEQAELSPEELSVVMADHRYITVKPSYFGGPGSCFRSIACCTTTEGRHGIR